MNTPILAVRTDAGNPNHHLWNNNGTWWIHCTVHYPDFTSRRLRRSLKTRDLDVARTRRDCFFARISEQPQAA